MYNEEMLCGRCEFMKSHTKKFISFLLCLCLIFTVTGFGASVPEQASAQTVDELNEELKLVDEKLESLKAQGASTEEYLRVLNERLDNLKKQYTIIKNEVTKTNNSILQLEKSIEQNKQSIEKIHTRLGELEVQSEKLNEQFKQTYTEYCKRIRALYVSGDLSSSLGFLLNSDGLSQLLTRLEMVSAVSRRDAMLISIVKQQTSRLAQTREELKQNEELLVKTQSTLESDSENLKLQQANLDEQKRDMEKRQAEIEAQQLEANKVLDKVYSNTEMYEKQHDKLMQEIDDAIAAADDKYKPVTTTTTTTTTTTQPSTTGTPGKPTTTTTTTTQSTASPSGKLSMTYPCPAYKTITCAFGAYSGHSGCDFATGGQVNQRIVAAESGKVIVSADLTNPDGSYRSYGRYIVIRHDKTNSSGKTVYTLYAHNNSREVEEDEYVQKGQLIALSGSTGNSTGPHLHFEVRVGGTSQAYAVDPELYLP